MMRVYQTAKRELPFIHCEFNFDRKRA